jgi:hypothetical protein
MRGVEELVNGIRIDEDYSLLMKCRNLPWDVSIPAISSTRQKRAVPKLLYLSSSILFRSVRTICRHLGSYIRRQVR